MRKEWLIKLFLLINKLFFGLFSIFPTRDKITFLCDFGDNASYTIQALNNKGYTNIVVLTTNKCRTDFSQHTLLEQVPFEVKNGFKYIKGMYHLATSKTLLVDNYFPILSVLPARIECIQLWHAAGAIKKFALSDPSISYRSPAAVQRFRNVYARMDKIVVGSEQMSKIFRLAFHKAPNAFLRTGIPRTDFYFDEERIAETKKNITEQHPEIAGKKVVLYAPTFRDLELQNQSIPINFNRIINELGEAYILLIKLHPAVAHSLKNIHHERILVLDNSHAIDELLTVTDYLISDYSSIPFEFAFFEKPQIFYPYDIEQYRMSRGFWSDYKELVPGPVVESDDELIHAILHVAFDSRLLEDYSKQWNTFSKGHSSSTLADYLIGN
ncbi:MAG: CDP-glycerol glycerophosphotransferase family protein [Kurthia sp.]|nr:CDP-glycerol glycerophosphotransferase family protein [Candidatus Kurthia equi]